MPPAPSTPLRAITTSTSVAPAPEMNALLPLITHASPSRRAPVRSDAASEPAFGSVRQYDASLSPRASAGPHSAATSGRANAVTIHVAMLWMVR